MSGLITSAAAILSASERRLETTSANVANVSTPGYKRQIRFADLVGADLAGADLVGLDGLDLPAQTRRVRADMAQGKLASTGNPLDLAISGDGFFQLRDGTDLVYSRQGQFKLAADGMVTTPQGQALQQAGGGDLMLDHAAVRIDPDGTVFDAGKQIARIAVFSPSPGGSAQPIDGSLFRMAEGAAEQIASPQLRQGMVETSNVSVGDEMVTMMAALRQAESGARLVQTWDDLMGRAITTFGETGR